VPLVKKVWMHDQILKGGHWMQGSWLYIEVEPARWVGTTSSLLPQLQPATVTLPQPAAVKEPTTAQNPSSSGNRLGALGGKQ
jgi:hypothetical protein